MGGRDKYPAAGVQESAEEERVRRQRELADVFAALDLEEAKRTREEQMGIVRADLENALLHPGPDEMERGRERERERERAELEQEKKELERREHHVAEKEAALERERTRERERAQEREREVERERELAKEREKILERERELFKEKEREQEAKARLEAAQFAREQELLLAEREREKEALAVLHTSLAVLEVRRGRSSSRRRSSSSSSISRSLPCRWCIVSCSAGSPDSSFSRALSHTVPCLAPTRALSLPLCCVCSWA